MARYIVPAEMPKSCAHCQFSFWVKGRTSKKEYRCALTGLYVCLELNDFETKADWCPLVDAADVVPKSEVEKLREVNSLLIEAGQEWQKRYENLAREIFEEIDKKLEDVRIEYRDHMNINGVLYTNGARSIIAELKKKYIPEELEKRK